MPAHKAEPELQPPTLAPDPKGLLNEKHLSEQFALAVLLCTAPLTRNAFVHFQDLFLKHSMLDRTEK